MLVTKRQELDFLKMLIPTLVGILVISTLLLYFWRRKYDEIVKVTVEPLVLPPNVTDQNLMSTQDDNLQQDDLTLKEKQLNRQDDLNLKQMDDISSQMARIQQAVLSSRNFQQRQSPLDFACDPNFKETIDPEDKTNKVNEKDMKDDEQSQDKCSPSPSSKIQVIEIDFNI